MSRPEPVRPLATVDRLAAFGPGESVRWRDGLRAGIDVSATGLAIALAGRTIRLPAEARDAVEKLAAGGVAIAGQLAGLDEHDSLVVARRLVREGVLVIDG